ncbi:hypothetical protein CEP52_014767 [Fusarium oligoseptatum]|uniref:Uncharacterized protein n=1 Tax=Fusarium oligoseptatum TaxID=2604345 RepID=A0A428SJC3_9HYPO|nr:hypothetical protein CEP52_014767 [Fusarium oligoseptatum]
MASNRWPGARREYELHEHLARNNIPFDSRTLRDEMIDLLERHDISHQDVMASGPMTERSALPFPDKPSRGSTPEGPPGKRQTRRLEELLRAESEFLKDDRTQRLFPNIWQLPEADRDRALYNRALDFISRYPDKDVFDLWFYSDQIFEQQGISEEAEKLIDDFVASPVGWDLNWANPDDRAHATASRNRAFNRLMEFRAKYPQTPPTSGVRDGQSAPPTTGGRDGQSAPPTTGGRDGQSAPPNTQAPPSNTQTPPPNTQTPPPNTQIPPPNTQTPPPNTQAPPPNTGGVKTLTTPPPPGDDDTPYDSKERREWRAQYHGIGDSKANQMNIMDPEDPNTLVIADILGRHPVRKTWLAVALPSRNVEYPKLSRGYYINAGAMYPDAFSRYVKEGSNITLSTATHKSQMENCTWGQFELNLVLCMPWGDKWHYHAYGIPHYIKERDFMLWSKALLTQCWKGPAMEVLHDHMIKSGQSIPISSDIQNRIKPQSWRKGAPAKKSPV